MRSTIRVIPYGLGLINPEENSLIQEWGSEAFGNLAVCKEFQYQCGSDYCVLAYCEDVFVGFAAAFRREVRVGGKLISLGCIGGVITRPDFRGKGYGTMMMKELDRIIFRSLDCEIGGLLCEKKTVGFYERLGWVRSVDPVWVDRDGNKVQWPEAFMYLAKSDAERYSREIDLCGPPW